MSKPKDKPPVDLATLGDLSKEQLLKFAEEQGIEVSDGAEKEAIIKSIDDFFELPKTPPPKDNPPDNPPTGGNEKGIVIKSVKRAGKTISAVTGKPITFDKDGKATVDPKDAEYLTGISGFEKA